MCWTRAKWPVCKPTNCRDSKRCQWKEMCRGSRKLCGCKRGPLDLYTTRQGQTEGECSGRCRGAHRRHTMSKQRACTSFYCIWGLDWDCLTEKQNKQTKNPQPDVGHKCLQEVVKRRKLCKCNELTKSSVLPQEPFYHLKVGALGRPDLRLSQNTPGQKQPKLVREVPAYSSSELRISELEK